MPVVQSLVYAATQTGGGFLGFTSDGLTDGIPARVARIQWMSVAGSTSDHIRLSILLSGSNSPLRTVCVLGLTLPVGTLLTAQLINGHAGFNVVAELSARAVRFANGTIGAWFVFSAAKHPMNRMDILIFNDVFGAASIAASAIFEIGEIAAMQAFDIELGPDWSDELIDPTEVNLTRDSQPKSVPRLPYRRIEGELTVGSRLAVRGAGLGDMDWAKLRYAMTGDRRVIAIPRWLTDAGTVEQSEVNATAIYGTGRLGKVMHAGGDYYSVSVAFTEAPTKN